ncbi:MAG: hypothetical protein J1G05_03015 [Clostridiales bacterium]|nr:hypothetical protein [Clostridiales bacterium]
MSKEGIVERILSDAEDRAQAIVAAAEKQAEGIIAEAEDSAKRDEKGVKAEAEEKCAAIKSGKEAEARLDSAKVLLAQKRRVIDSIYERALSELKELKKADAVAFADKILQQFAEDGDIIAFAPDFKYAQEVSRLDICAEKKLKIALNAEGVNGGFVLRGKVADKDVSYSALLLADREQYEVEIAAEVFLDK